jgi:hypothetical protein
MATTAWPQPGLAPIRWVGGTLSASHQCPRSRHLAEVSQQRESTVTDALRLVIASAACAAYPLISIS